MAVQVFEAASARPGMRCPRSPLICLTGMGIWLVSGASSLQAVAQSEARGPDCLQQFTGTMVAVMAVCDRSTDVPVSLPGTTNNNLRKLGTLVAQESGRQEPEVRGSSPADAWLLMSDPIEISELKSNTETTDTLHLQPDHLLPPQPQELTIAANLSFPSAPTKTLADATNLDLDPQTIEDSPVLQRWLEEVPDIDHSINHDPAFRTQVRIGYAEFPSTDHTSGIYVGVQDLFIGQTPLTLSAEYAANGRGDRRLIGADAQYYLLPLGWYANLAPVVGYRAIDTPDFSTEGVNLGIRLVLVPSRNGATDLAFTQSWVTPGSSAEISLTKFTVGYAITRDFRLATDFQWQSTPARNESRVSLLLEWMP